MLSDPQNTLMVLPLVAFVVSVFNTTVGASGGLMVGALSLFVPVPGSLVLHSIVSAFSSSHRAIGLREHIDTKLIPIFMFALGLGLLVAIPMYEAIGSKWWAIAIAVYLIGSGAFPNNFNSALKNVPALIVFFISGLVSLVFGTGSKVYSPYLLHLYDRRQTRIAMLSVFAALQHLIKLPIMLWIFHLDVDFVPLAVGLCLGSVLGNWAGSKALFHLTDRTQAWFQSVTLVLVGTALLLKSIEYI